MKIELLREFLVLTRCKNFTTAAEELFITQPVLSRHISALEEEVGLLLFNRSPSGISLTENGQFFLKRVSKLMGEYDDLLNELELRKHGIKNVLRIGGAYYAMNDYLGLAPQFFAANKANNGCILSYLAVEPIKCMMQLNAGELDVMLLPRSALVENNSLKCVNLFEEPLVAVMNRKNPLSEKQYLSLDDLKEQHFLVVENKMASHYHYGLWFTFSEACAEAGFTPQVEKTFSQLEALLFRIPYEDGIYIGGRHLNKQCNIEGVSIVPIVGKNCTRKIVAVYNKENHNPYIPLFLKGYSNIPLYGWESTYIGVENLLAKAQEKEQQI